MEELYINEREYLTSEKAYPNFNHMDTILFSIV